MADEFHSLGRESERLAFKASVRELEEGVISIAAMLNRHGEGTLYFGVDRDGRVIGVEITETTLRAVSHAILDQLHPTNCPEIRAEEYDGKKVIRVSFQGTDTPYLACDQPYIRIGDQDLRMDRSSYEEMKRRRDRRNGPWEGQDSKYTTADIDRDAFSLFLRKAREAGRTDLESDDPAAVLSMLEVSEGDRLLNAGAALFVSRGINELQMAKFASDERLTFTDIRHYTGSIVTLADRAYRYVIDAMDWRVEFTGALERTEIPEIPLVAVREAILNAFVHRAIESWQSVEVAVYRSFLEISSYGRFPEGMTPEMFIRENRRPIRRNPRIAQALSLPGDTDRFATGLKRIQEACDAAGCRVEYRGNQYGFTVRFYRHCGAGWGDRSQFVPSS